MLRTCLVSLPKSAAAAGTSMSSVRTLSTSSARLNLARMNLVGRLGRQPEITKDKQGRDIMIYTVATSDRSQSLDGGDAKNDTMWHRVLSYRTNSASAVEYLGSLEKGTLVHIEADFKRRTIKNEEENTYTEQTLLLLRNIDVIQRPKNTDDAAAAPESS